MSYLATYWTPSTVLPLVGSILHAGRHQPMAAQQMSLQTRVSEEATLTLLTIEGRTVVDHLGVDLDLRRRHYRSVFVLAQYILTLWI